MTDSLRALLTGVIDYAGLFPPATLPLEQAIRNYARYRTEAESWMLGKFVCPAAKLQLLTPYIESEFAAGPPLRLTLLLGHQAERETAEAERFEASQAGRVQIDSFEVNESHFPFAWERTLFIEGAAAKEGVPAGKGLGFKFRCGGLSAAAFPSVQQLAEVIFQAIATAALKFTAGLHHPIRHFDPSLQVKMHGFINVFVAGVLADARNLREERILRILEDEDSASFRFDDQALHWRDLSASVAEITAARRWITSFGSCSFDEPRDDLRRLGWL